MLIRYSGELGFGVTAKDLILGTIGQIGVGGGAGHVIEFTGSVIDGLSMEGRMTVCNMTIEGGGRAGMVAPDDTTYRVRDRPSGRARRGAGRVARASTPTREPSSTRSPTSTPRRSRRRSPGAPTPGWSSPSPDSVPDASSETTERALKYMDLQPGTPIEEIRLDRVFIGSCTNSRIGDLRAAASVIKGRKVHPDVDAMVVPGSPR